MRICILAPDEHVEAIRETARNNFPQFLGKSLLHIPVSPTGELPITHWFCNFKISQEMYEKLINLRNLSEMEIYDFPHKFLDSKGLKIVTNR